MKRALVVAGYTAELKVAPIWQQPERHWCTERDWDVVPKASGGKTPNHALLGAEEWAKKLSLTPWLHPCFLNGGWQVPGPYQITTVNPEVSGQ
jgi:hypothetical protein